MTIDHPYDIGGSGRTATTDPDDHVRDMIEQLRHPAPGDGGRRPDWGAGHIQEVCDRGAPAPPATAQYLVQSALERHLGQVLTADRVEVEAVDSALLITVSYVVLRTRTRAIATFRTPGGRP
ncbi:hypothetical protein [Streptomyces sp. NPDC059538]|uniref:hypothetical protein n=1 Tax=Streptomyces sp. NPDC059538 TaxID=3346860 RepID=UPI003684CC00